MVFLRDEETAARWQQIEPHRRDLFALPEAIAIAVGHFQALLPKEGR